MALKRVHQYQIEAGAGMVLLTIEALPRGRDVLIYRESEGGRDAVSLKFEYIPELIRALEEIRREFVPSPAAVRD
jgi:hypothetical protein